MILGMDTISDNTSAVPKPSMESSILRRNRDHLIGELAKANSKIERLQAALNIIGSDLRVLPWIRAVANDALRKEGWDRD